MQHTPRKPGRKPRSRLGSQAVHWTITREVIAALRQIEQESDQGETTSHFVDNWLREHPQVKVELEKEYDALLKQEVAEIEEIEEDNRS